MKKHNGKIGYSSGSKEVYIDYDYDNKPNLDGTRNRMYAICFFVGNKKTKGVALFKTSHKAQTYIIE